MHGHTPLDTLLFVTIVYSPSIVRWTIAAIAYPRIIQTITVPRTAVFIVFNILLQFLVAMAYPHFISLAGCAGENWCGIIAATKAVALMEGMLSLIWMAIAGTLRKRR